MDSRGKLDYFHTGNQMYVLPVRGGQCNTDNCDNIAPEDSPIVSVPSVARVATTNTPLTIYDALPGDLQCTYSVTSLSTYKERFDSVGQTSVIDVMSQVNTQKTANKSAPINWSFISGANKSLVYGSAYCAYNYKSVDKPRSNLVVYRDANTMTFQARTSVAAAKKVAAQITCNTNDKPNQVQTVVLQGNNSITCNIGSSSIVPNVELNTFAPSVN